MIPTDVHSYSRSFAKEHTVTGAIVVKHIGYKVRHSKNVRDGRRWCYNPAKEFARKMPYLSSSTISSIVKKLEASGVLEIGNYNKRKADRTQWYHVPDEVCAEVELDLIRFDSKVAQARGILPAVLHYNLCFFLKKQRAKPGVVPSHTMSAKQLAKLLNYSESAIKKALRILADAQAIVKCTGRAKYTLPQGDLELLRRSRLKL
jgi:hypothetical protein